VGRKQSGIATHLRLT